MVQVRPVDILRQLLLEQRGPDTEAVRLYFQSQSPEQACASCLILATIESTDNTQLAEWATRAFLLYGGQKITNVHPGMELHVGMDIRTSTPRVGPGYDFRTAFQGRPQHQSGINLDVALQQFSSKHGGLYLYIGRILRPIWNLKCLKQEVVNNKVQYVSTINASQVGWLLGSLQVRVFGTFFMA